jgi:hypothetical protein
LDHCRDRGSLKVIVTAEGVASSAVRSLTESRGFQFSRVRSQADGTEALEFYVDLYWRERSA